jgi:hypothetical protein
MSEKVVKGILLMGGVLIQHGIPASYLQWRIALFWSLKING